MKKMVFATLLFSTGLIAVSTVQAEEQSADSPSSVTINAGSGPVTPEEPNNPDNPGDGGETGQNGPLSIDQVIPFAFEDVNLSGTAQTANLKATGMRNVQVTDARGTGKGWQLQVKQSPLTEDTGETQKTLTGAAITLKNGQVTAGQSNVSTQAPTLNGTSLTLNENFQPMTTAQESAGLGTWLMKYNNENTTDIQLTVPAGNLAGSYTGTVTWQLSDSPAANSGE